MQPPPVIVRLVTVLATAGVLADLNVVINRQYLRWIDGNRAGIATVDVHRQWTTEGCIDAIDINRHWSDGGVPTQSQATCQTDVTGVQPKRTSVDGR